MMSHVVRLPSSKRQRRPLREVLQPALTQRVPQERRLISLILGCCCTWLCSHAVDPCLPLPSSCQWWTAIWASAAQTPGRCLWAMQARCPACGRRPTAREPSAPQAPARTGRPTMWSAPPPHSPRPHRRILSAAAAADPWRWWHASHYAVCCVVLGFACDGHVPAGAAEHLKQPTCLIPMLPNVNWSLCKFLISMYEPILSAIPTLLLAYWTLATCAAVFSLIPSTIAPEFRHA